MFDLPLKWQDFYNDMVDRSKKYIELNYWSIDKANLNLWLNNFKTDHEKFFSALLLYKVIYRNKFPRLSMFQHIVDIILPQILEEENIYTIKSLDDFHSKLKYDKYSLNFKFSSVLGTDKNPAKSGAQILREFQREGRFHKDLLVSFSELNDLDTKIKAIILFDDIMGTGEQLEEYIIKLGDLINKFKFIYCPMVATTKGLKFIDEKYKHQIKVLPVEVLNEDFSFFNKKTLPKIVEDIELKDLKELYLQIMKKIKINKKAYFGYGELSLTYFFDVSSPNNTLPIYWYEEENKWENLFPR